MSDGLLTDSQRLLIAYAYTKKPTPSFFDAMGRFNDVHTRYDVQRSLIDYLSGLKSNKDIYDFKVICDETNNPSTVIDQHGLFVDVTVQPRMGPTMYARIPGISNDHILDGMRALFSHLKMPKGFSI